MSIFKSIPLADIHVPNRLREVEEDHALAIQASIVEHGLLNPITVRSTPNAKKGAKPYTLVAGAHRYRAVELLDDEGIEAVVVEADALEAQLIEIEENVFRNDLSAMDRAVFIQSYRDVWEKKHGAVKRGNPNFSNSVNLTQLLAEEAKQGFSRHVAERQRHEWSWQHVEGNVRRLRRAFHRHGRRVPSKGSYSQNRGDQ